MNILVEVPGRAKRLKSATHEAHERLDQRIMVAQPFAARGIRAPQHAPSQTLSDEV